MMFKYLDPDKKPTAKELKSNFYVDKDQFYDALKEYRERALPLKEAGLTYPPPSDYIGDCIIKIATKYSYSPNFVGYPFRSEMILDAIEDCVKSVLKFDPSVSRQAFSYFTQVTHYSFLRTIKEEKKILRGKWRYINNLDIDTMSLQEHDDDFFQNNYIEFLKSEIGEYDESAEQEKKAKKPKDIVLNSNPLPFGDEDE